MVPARVPWLTPSRYRVWVLAAPVRTAWCHLPSVTVALEVMVLMQPGDMARQPRSLPSMPTYTAGVFLVVVPTGSVPLSGLSP